MADLQLHFRIQREADTLVLQYGVENPSQRDVYLLNRVHDQSLQTSPEMIYIELDRANRIVVAYKNIPEIPSGPPPTMPVAPYVTPVRAGARFAETVRIPLPVREFRAYTAVPEDGRPKTYAGLSFTLGYYWSVPGMQESTQQIVPGVEVIIPRNPPGTSLEFGTLTSGVQSLEIPVLEPT